MVEMLAVHGSNQTDIVRDTTQTWEQFGEFHPALAVSDKPEGRRQHGADLVGEFDLVYDVATRRRACELLQHRLRIEQVHLTRAAILEQLNDGFRFGREMRRLRFQIVDGGTCGWD